jgi:hypothetical protein
VWSELTSRGSNIIGESIVLGIPVTTLIPRVKKVGEYIRTRIYVYMYILCVYGYGYVWDGCVCLSLSLRLRSSCVRMKRGALTIPHHTTHTTLLTQLLTDTEAFHRRLDPLIDARVLMMNKGEEMPDDALTVMVKEKVSLYLYR